MKILRERTTDDVHREIVSETLAQLHDDGWCHDHGIETYEYVTLVDYDDCTVQFKVSKTDTAKIGNRYSIIVIVILSRITISF